MLLLKPTDFDQNILCYIPLIFKTKKVLSFARRVWMTLIHFFFVITNKHCCQLNIINWRQICHNIFDGKHTTNLLSLRINGNITTCKFETYSRNKISDLILKHHSLIWGRSCKTFLGSLYARSLHDRKILFHRLTKIVYLLQNSG
jgi:hypothetical protein